METGHADPGGSPATPPTTRISLGCARGILCDVDAAARKARLHPADQGAPITVELEGHTTEQARRLLGRNVTVYGRLERTPNSAITKIYAERITARPVRQHQSQQSLREITARTQNALCDLGPYGDSAELVRRIRYA